MPSAPDDLLLLLVGSVVATRLFALVLRRGAFRQHTAYVLLLGGDLVALGIARSLQSNLIAFVAEAAGALLSIAPFVLDAAEAALYRRDRLKGALWLAKLREVFVPGQSSSQRRRDLEQRWAAHSGDSARAITALKADIGKTSDADEAQRLRVDLILLLFATGDLDAGLELAQRHLGPESFQRSPMLTAAVGAALAARGRLALALQLLLLLEHQVAAAPGQTDIQTQLTRVRLAFVAGAGLGERLEALLAQKATRSELSSIEVETLRRIAREAQSPETEIRIVAGRVAECMQELDARVSAPVRRRAPVTLLIIVTNLVVMGVVTALHLGDDELGLARVGALYGPAVASGEWWRLVSVAWLHAGPFHLFANMYALYFLGRANEELLGWPRFVVVYAVAAFGGALASLWADRGLSVGASGAIMGLLASLTVIIFVRRDNFHPAARRMLLGNLVFLGVLQAFLGWQLPLIDSAAHAGGFVAGLVASLGLNPGGDVSPLGRRLAMAASILYALVCLATVPLVVRRSLATTLLTLPTHTVELDGTKLDVPRAWRREEQHLFDPYLGIELSIERKPDAIHILCPQADDPRVRPLLDRISATAHQAP
ncbi:MAG: rhomboid family intramembrane serine protease [Polyangia bacterium]